MRAGVLYTGALLLALSALPAAALKVLVRLSPQNAAGEGFTVSARREAEGAVEFRVTRDPAKARWQGRTAQLEVRGSAGRLVRCRLEPERTNGLLTYTFDIAESHVPGSRLTVMEVQTGPGAEKFIGGGTYYEINLADFLAR